MKPLILIACVGCRPLKHSILHNSLVIFHDVNQNILELRREIFFVNNNKQ